MSAGMYVHNVYSSIPGTYIPRTYLVPDTRSRKGAKLLFFFTGHRMYMMQCRVRQRLRAKLGNRKSCARLFGKFLGTW